MLERNKRSSHAEMFCKNDGLKNFSKFTWKHMRLSLCLNKVGLQLNWKKILWHMIFLWILWNFIRTPFYITSLVATSRIGLSPTLSLPSSESSLSVKKTQIKQKKKRGKHCDFSEEPVTSVESDWTVWTHF